MNYKLFSFFSGAGFLDYGFESEGFDVVYVNEYHKPFVDAYKYARKQLRISKPQYGYYSDSISDFAQLEVNKTLTSFLNDSRKNGSLIGLIGDKTELSFSLVHEAFAEGAISHVIYGVGKSEIIK